MMALRKGVGRVVVKGGHGLQTKIMLAHPSAYLQLRTFISQDSYVDHMERLGEVYKDLSETYPVPQSKSEDKKEEKTNGYNRWKSFAKEALGNEMFMLLFTNIAFYMFFLVKAYSNYEERKELESTYTKVGQDISILMSDKVAIHAEKREKAAEYLKLIKILVRDLSAYDRSANLKLLEKALSDSSVIDAQLAKQVDAESKDRELPGLIAEEELAAKSQKYFYKYVGMGVVHTIIASWAVSLAKSPTYLRLASPYLAIIFQGLGLIADDQIAADGKKMFERAITERVVARELLGADLSKEREKIRSFKEVLLGARQTTEEHAKEVKSEGRLQYVPFFRARLTEYEEIVTSLRYMAEGLKKELNSRV